MYGVIFISLSILALLGDATTLASDGTFRSAPELFNQVYTIHVDYQEHSFPFAYVLMTHRNQLLYSDVLNHIKETVSLEFPGISLCNIKYCISDFEPAILGAMTVAFPSAVAKGCWFHYGQAIYRKASELGLSVAYKQKGVVFKIVKEIIALALLPAKDILEGFQV
jgi:ribosomal protein L7/L12